MKPCFQCYQAMCRYEKSLLICNPLWELLFLQIKFWGIQRHIGNLKCLHASYKYWGPEQLSHLAFTNKKPFH